LLEYRGGPKAATLNMTLRSLDQDHCGARNRDRPATSVSMAGKIAISLATILTELGETTKKETAAISSGK
jgi:hypothetical protein